MLSCRINKANLDFSDLQPINSSQNQENRLFAMQNFRLLTSHLKSRQQTMEKPEIDQAPLRPKTTPNLYWNFMNFEERKKAKNPPDLQKTLQRLNIRSFNNILRSQSMRKKTIAPLYRNSLLMTKTESGKVRKLKKAEFYTLGNVKYNNYKYQKINLDEERRRNFLGNEREKEKQHRNASEEKELVMKNINERELIDKLKANKIHYFEKNKFLLKKQFEQSYKMSESMKVMKQELKQSHFDEKPRMTKTSTRKRKEEAETMMSFYPLEKVKWESLFFGELKYLLHISNLVQKKMTQRERNENSEENEIAFEKLLKSKVENETEEEGKIGIDENFMFLGVILNYSKLFKSKNKVIAERILLGFGLNPKNTLDKLSDIKFEEIYSLMSLISSRKELYQRFVVLFLKGGSDEEILEKDQFISLVNLLNQNEYPKKAKLGIFEKYNIISDYSRKFDFERFEKFMAEKEVEFFDFVRLVFSNARYS